MEKTIGIALIIIGLITGIAAFECYDTNKTALLSVGAACFIILGGVILNEQ